MTSKIGSTSMCGQQHGNRIFHADSQCNRETKRTVVNRAIEEVSIYSNDSIKLAILILESKCINTPNSLIELNRLHQNFPKSRSHDFAQASHELKIQALDDLNELLSSI